MITMLLVVDFTEDNLRIVVLLDFRLVEVFLKDSTFSFCILISADILITFIISMKFSFDLNKSS